MPYCDKFIENGFKFKLEDIKALNEFYDETLKKKKIDFLELMEYDEAVEAKEIIDEFLAFNINDFKRGELLPLFHEANTPNYIIYYYKGDYEGKAFYLNHEQIIIAPIFNNLGEVTEYILNKKEYFIFDYYTDFSERFKKIGIEILI